MWMELDMGAPGGTNADPRAQAARSSPLTGKLAPPQPTGFEVARTEVCERIFTAGAARLVFLRAPAGFGKTTAMLQVRERLVQTGVPSAWLTLDSGDNDVGRFLSGLLAALAPIIPALAREQAASADGGPDAVVFSVIDRVAAHPGPFVLFLDDFEVLQNRAVVGLVSELIEQLPRGAQIVLGSRMVPELGLGRLRARGRLLEVEPRHLRFSEAEVDFFLRHRRGVPLLPDDVRRLHRSTEGWAAALWLASLALEHRDQPGTFIAGFSGSNASVVDYLAEDVLARQTEEVRGFLLRTSVLSELSAPLCDAVCGRTDSASMLRWLEQAHLFLVPLQSAGGLYRYHGMFAEFLRTQLERHHPGEAARLHQAAADWFLAAGRPVPAIHHRLAAGNFEAALLLLERHVQALLDQGRVRLLSRWLDPLHARGLLQAHPLLLVYHAWAVCFTRGAREATGLLDALEARADPEAEVRAHLMVMRPLFLALRDQTEQALPLATSALDRLPVDVGFLRTFLEVTLANLMLIAGRYQEALRFADAARARQPEHSSSFNFALSEAAAAAVDLTQGRLRKAVAGLRVAASAGALDGTQLTNGNALAGVPLAEALYEAGQLDQAERLLVIYIPLIRHVGIPDQLICAHVVMARIAADRGEIDRAQQLLTELEHIGHRDGLARVVACARLERVRMLLMAGRLADAHAELGRCGDRSLWARVEGLSFRANEVEGHALGYARWAVRSGHAAEVIAPLRAELDAAERVHRLRRALTLRLVLALALYRDEQRNKSMRVLAKAVWLASAEGYVRAFVDEGPLVLALLRELRATPDLVHQEAGGDQALAFIDGLLGGASQPAGAGTPRESPPLEVPGEILTRKELQVLRLAAEGLSNEELAERLFVAETTVRTHLRNINVKLDARNRTEAIAAARRRNLIS